MDFKQIAQNPIMGLAERLGWQLTEAKTTIGDESVPQFVGTCPISQTGGKTAFKITPSLNRFVCFCSDCRKNTKPGGDIIELMRRLRRCDVREAAAEVQKLFDGAGKAGDNGRPQQEVADGRKPLDFDPLKYLASLDTEHEALSELGITADTLRAAKAGYASKGLNRGRLALWCESIKAFIGLALNGETPEYVVPKGSTLPNWYLPPTLLKNQPLRVLPDILSVMRAMDCGESNVICPLKTTSDTELHELANLLEANQCTVTW